MKKLLLAFIILASFAFVSCSTEPATEEPQTSPAVTETEEPEPAVEDQAEEEPASEDTAQTMDLTIDELAQYNGKDGAKAYVAINGVVYDVTDNPQWSSGEHGGQMAGTDITDVFPHADGREMDLPIVGNIVE